MSATAVPYPGACGQRCSRVRRRRLPASPQFNGAAGRGAGQGEAGGRGQVGRVGRGRAGLADGVRAGRVTVVGGGGSQRPEFWLGCFGNCKRLSEILNISDKSFVTRRSHTCFCLFQI